jgi:hypothetical protein
MYSAKTCGIGLGMVELWWLSGNGIKEEVEVGFLKTFMYYQGLQALAITIWRSHVTGQYYVSIYMGVWMSPPKSAT